MTQRSLFWTDGSGDGGPSLAQRPDVLDGLQSDARLVEHAQMLCQWPRNHRFTRSQREGGWSGGPGFSGSPRDRVTVTTLSEGSGRMRLRRASSRSLSAAGFCGYLARYAL